MGHSCRCGQVVLLARLAVQDMDDLYAERHEYISDQAAMTPPPQKFRTQNRRAKRIRSEEEREQTVRELVARQMLGVPPKGRVAPRGLGGTTARPAATSQGRKPTILNVADGKCGSKYRAIELRVSPGAGKASDVGDQLNLVGGQQREERHLRPGGMTHGPDGKCHLLEWYTG